MILAKILDYQEEDIRQMSYQQLTSGERYMLAALRKQGLSQAEMARSLGRHRSTIYREFRRNCSSAGGHYRPSKA